LDKFPEAFGRLERHVDLRGIHTFPKLLLVASSYFGPKFGSPKQITALRVEARRLGIPEEPRSRPWQHSWRHEIVTVRGEAQSRYRDLKTGRFRKKPLE
jgi:hypothetical protein